MARRERRPAGGYSAPALEKGLDIVELLAAASTPLSTRAIAESIGRSKSEIFRMVFVLVQRGYLVRDATSDELTLSNRLFDLGMRTPRSRQLVEVAVPAMERLGERTGQSAHLVVVNRGETVVVATTTGTADVSFTLRLGYRRPAHDATSGRIVMAFQRAARRATMLQDSFAASGDRTDKEEIAAALDAIAKTGHLVAESHDVIGVTDIGAPVLSRRGEAVASIVVPFLNRHGALPRHDVILEALIDTCREIGDALG